MLGNHFFFNKKDAMMENMLIVIGALHRGIIPPDFCIDEALASLPEEEARKARRKFRKMVRKIAKSSKVPSGESVAISPRSKRMLVRHECHRIGLDLVGDPLTQPREV